MPAMTAVTAPLPGRDGWRGRPVAQEAIWPDRAKLGTVTAELAGLAPLVSPAECDLLKDRLAAVARGEAFVLQGGDCAETFAGANPHDVRAKLQTLLQMAVVLTYGASIPVVKIGRMAGQFAKPRSRPTEVRDGVELPAYRGDAVNGLEFSPEARIPGPGPAAARLPLFGGHAEHLPGLHQRRVRRPAPDARLEPGLRPGQPVRAAL